MIRAGGVVTVTAGGAGVVTIAGGGAGRSTVTVSAGVVTVTVAGGCVGMHRDRRMRRRQARVVRVAGDALNRRVRQADVRLDRMHRV
jgi:hypothetical protein